MVTPTRSVPRGHARHYLAKAEEFADAAQAEYAAGRNAACGLAAVHAGISACDALTAHVRGVVSTAKNHTEAVGVLRTCFDGHIPQPHEQQLIGLLAVKNDIEYSGRALKPERARTVLDQATRFTKWARDVVGGESRPAERGTRGPEC